ncbi:MAG: glycosyltransferase family 4 protein [Candidatus Abyssubacteria bacterium]|nr:glycosyltransferase family 4 protein [Candidatus Abyssubacteria bacterium]
MRIVQVVHAFPPESMTGTELCTYYLSKELARAGHELFVFTASRNIAEDRYHIVREKYEGLDVARIGNWFQSELDQWRTFVDFQVENGFRDYIKEVNPDIVHIQHLLGLSTSIVQVLFEMSIPIVFTAHDYWYVCPKIQLLDRNGQVCSGPAEGYKCEWCVADLLEEPGKNGPAENVTIQAPSGFSIKRMLPARLKHGIKTALVPEIEEIGRLSAEVQSLRKEIERLHSSMQNFVGRYDFLASMLNKVDLIITPSAYTKMKCVGFGFPEEKVRTVYHGLHTESFGKKTKSEADVIRFAYFGGFLKHKGIEVLLEAFSNVPRSEGSLQIFGSESNAETKKHLKQLAGPADVVFRGRYDNNHMSELLSDVDVVIVPSLWEETFNLVVREAFLTNTPVIASRIGALEEAIEEGVDGFLVQPGSVQEMRRKIQMLISDPEILPRLKQGIKPVKDLSRQASEIESVYEEIISKHRSEASRDRTQDKDRG